MSSSVARLVQEALSHQHAGRIGIALPMFEEVLRLDPNNPQAHFSLGIAAYQHGDIGPAIGHLQKAAKKAGKNHQVHQLLGLALLNAGDYPAAREALKKAAGLAPKQADIHAQLGDLYRLDRRPVLARQSFQRALQLDAVNGYALLGMGQLEVTVGNIDAAVGWFQKALDAGKELPAVLHALSMARKYDEVPAELATIESLLGDGTPRAPLDQSNLHWAAGKIHFDLGDAGKADDHYQAARKLRYPPFDLKAHEERVTFMKEVFDKAFFESRTEMGSDSVRPVFIFGMPRSGTTLVEQIVSRHSRVASGGELAYFRHLQEDLGLKAAPSAALERRLRELEPKDFRKFARGYLSVLDAVDRKAARVTDKMPHNFEMLWLMSLAFPKAAYIHCVREPADTCVSLLSHAMSPAHNYAITQETLGRYFQTYVELMEHWAKVLPVSLYELSYEKLVESQETESRALLERTGLDWEDACLEFHKGESPVTTFSNLQVRRPMFHSSIGRWKKHADQLGPLFEALGPLAPKTD
ncbi:tetratricopeptide repeat-containing sulfotransferase family protein [Roseibium aggregatum]|uniref:Sulfotransferase n=1 Tax=Roseibium aggregatum TaxID=187304 RepID=A0A939J4F5_9HYPH|nr:sulfotransferase [Roseibium aggregatum]MBN9671130.1 sulfotransferase [Roseibium aggregatum]